MQRYLKWYLRRTGFKPNKITLNKFIEIQTQLLAPFAPHTCEEIWELIGKDGLVSESKWPSEDLLTVDNKSVKIEDAIKKTLEDTHQIIKIIGKEPSKIFYYVIPPELPAFKEALEFFNSEIGCVVEVFSLSDKDKYDPENKAKKAKPGKPGIYME